LKNKNGSPKLKANGEKYEKKDLLEIVKHGVAQKFRLLAKMPEPGDLVNETNFDLKCVAFYMKKFKKFDKEKKKYCKYELDKIKEMQVGFAKKVFGIFAAMMVVTMIPVLLSAFGKFEVDTTTNTGIFVALSIACLMIALLACFFLPCNAR